ncbi:dimethyladenosine transferase [Meridianimaribacter sp. CL38]|uniref:FkbM family methyltransferase n=1 Tax=Meridianimaribacter sp. CL38 TaxID=2213021 RepID=UPI00103A8368|nr:FkbM family methyltransferase [Meridianimaribacter sp. CL38]TBV25505.1 dimethyladenosine transferase [Meridianimaribacter sp. CL38]
MVKILKNIGVAVLKFIMPKTSFNSLKVKRNHQLQSRYLKKLTKKIIAYHKKSNDKEVLEVLDFLRNNEINVFPYSFINTYKALEIQVIDDEELGLKYVWHQHKRLYFKRSMSSNGIKNLYRGLLIDQDKKSPHLYLTSTFRLTENDVVADIGAAEGNFTLSNIETIKKAYIFESDIEWVEALEATFSPWKEKVEIINKFVTNCDSDTSLNISSFYQKHDDISFFKVDIEGEEYNFLNAASSIFKANVNVKIAICTYHKQNDEVQFTEMLRSLGFSIELSDGYMIFFYDKKIKPPYLRRGLIRAIKIAQ